jgi:uncharacterized membrane protein YgdD (TMEM256/DUF423 family)
MWLGALLAGSGVALGAFGAHALAPLIGEARLHTFETAVRYQFWHALALMLLGVQQQLGSLPARAAQRIGVALAAGVLVFATALYALVAGEALGNPLPFMGAVAPIGGVLMLSGWVLWAWWLFPWRRAGSR